jgi:hypothetical protein
VIIMAGVEETVRGSLRVQVGDQPSMDDPAGRAIAGARRVRNRRMVTGALAGAAVLVMAIGGLTVLRGHRPEPAPPVGPATVVPTTPGTPAPAAPTATPGGSVVDASLILDRHTLLTGDGGQVALDRIPGGAFGGYRTRDGWLINGYGDGFTTVSLWLVRPDRSLHPLVTGASAWVAVAPDGRRFAWRSGGKLHTGHLTGSASVVIDATSPAPDRGGPLAYTGTAVYIGATETGGGIDRHDVWLPARGAYVPSWDNPYGVAAVYRVAADGTSFLGLTEQPPGSKQLCLALLDPADRLRPTRSACGVVHTLDRTDPISPDGHWLVVPGGGSSASVIDLTSVFDTKAVAATWQEAGDGGVWVDPTTLVRPDGKGGLVRITVGPQGEIASTTVVTVPGLPAGSPAATPDVVVLTPLP